MKTVMKLAIILILLFPMATYAEIKNIVSEGSTTWETERPPVLLKVVLY